MPPTARMRGRGTPDNPPNRFERLHIEVDEDVHELPREPGAPVRTEYFYDTTRSLITRNDSPDVPFETSLNPYRGCEHGCVYCYARPYHEYLGLSAGLDFETKIFVKERAPDLLRDELSKRSWQPRMLALSGVTDPYQPVERRLAITRGCLQVLARFRNPVGVITKNILVTRDIDVLGQLAEHDAVHVALSLTTLDEGLRRVMEPRTATSDQRLEAVARLNDVGIPAGVMMAPLVPGLTDHEIPKLLERAAEAGARFAGYTMLRLPHAVAPLFMAWLDEHAPTRKRKVLGRLRDLRGGALTDSRYGSRMRGEGRFAELVASMFHTARERAGIPRRLPPLSATAFRRPDATPSLFD